MSFRWPKRPTERCVEFTADVVHAALRGALQYVYHWVT